MFGFLNVDKPRGCTSRDVVTQVQRLCRPLKVGHAGTLDPLARGVLVIACGPATRLIKYLHELPKRYHATFRLGCTSPSEDLETDVTPIEGAPVPTRELIDRTLTSFLGEIKQRPTAFSAIKVDGKRAYELARTGDQVSIEERSIQIHELAVLDFDYPEFSLDIACGTGTYIRTLGRDIARAMETDAVMTDLNRTEVGPFRIEGAVPLDAIQRDHLASLLQPPALALGGLACWQLSAANVDRLAHGLAVSCQAEDVRGLNRLPEEDVEVCVVDAEQRLRSIAKFRAADSSLRPRLNFPTD